MATVETNLGRVTFVAEGIFDPNKTDYKRLGVVVLDGSSYQATVDNPIGIPQLDGSNPDWQLIAKKGEDGEPGPEGPKGEGLEFDATGPIADRGDYDSESPGFVYLADDEGTFYVRLDPTGWSIGQSISGGLQTLSQPSIGQIAISSGNAVSLNTVNMSGNQTGIAGDKTWTGAHTFSPLSGVGDALAGLNASGQLTRATIPEQTNADWDATSGVAEILNKPTIGDGTLSLATGTGLTGSASFSANQTGADTFTVGVDAGYKLPTTAEWDGKADVSSLSAVATSGDYDDLDNKPTLGTAAALNTGTGSGEVRTNSQNDSRYLQSQRYKAVTSVAAARTIALVDEDCLWIVSGTRTLTVPTNASVAFPIGGRIDVQVSASGTANIEGAAGVTLTHKDGTGNTSREGFTMFTFIKTGTNAWTIVGG